MPSSIHGLGGESRLPSDHQLAARRLRRRRLPRRRRRARAAREDSTRTRNPKLSEVVHVSLSSSIASTSGGLQVGGASESPFIRMAPGPPARAAGAWRAATRSQDCQVTAHGPVPNHRDLDQVTAHGPVPSLIKKGRTQVGEVQLEFKVQTNNTENDIGQCRGKPESRCPKGPK